LRPDAITQLNRSGPPGPDAAVGQTSNEHVSTDVLARELVVSCNHLHKIVQYLTEVGLVRTIRGARGGVMLARPAFLIEVEATAAKD